MPESTSSRARRKSTGKRLRFSVFQRDHFTCQYCGAQPPAVVLVVDHIDPVARGGQTTIDNLITACETCNQGKADRSLGQCPVRPDADLMYLETQQEIAELRRFQMAAQEHDDLISEIIIRLGDIWQDYTGLSWVPKERILRTLIDRYGPEITEESVRRMAWRIAAGKVETSSNRWVGYLMSVARNVSEEYDEGDI